MEDITKDIFIEWERLLKNINEFNKNTSSYFHNAPYAFYKCKDLLEFMKKERIVLEEWCRKCLQKNRNQIYVRYWLDQGWNFLNGHNHGTGNLRFLSDPTNLQIIFQQEWNKINHLIGNKSEYNFKEAFESVKEAHEKQDIVYCDQSEIKKEHICKSNGWYCDDCEDMEYSWHRYLIKKIQESQNIFLNKECKRMFLEKANTIELVPEGWEPPLNNPLTQIQDIDIKTDGKTGYQLMYIIVEFATWQIRLWNLDKNNKNQNEFQEFFDIWEFIGSLDKKLGVLEKALEDVKGLFLFC